jgi:hypothetical protein
LKKLIIDACWAGLAFASGLDKNIIVEKFLKKYLFAVIENQSLNVVGST